MHRESHLVLDLTVLPASGELTISSPGWRFVLVQQGQGYLFTRPEVKSLDQGDLLVLPPQTDAPFRASQLGEMVLQYFHVLPDLLTGLLTLAERRRLDVRSKTGASRVLHLPAGDPLSQRFAVIGSLKSRTSSLVRRCQMLEMAGTVFAEELTLRPPRHRRIASARDRFHELVQQMTEAEFMAHPPEALAARCGCSLRHFSRLFRRHLGMSIRARQTQMRLLKARQMLVDTNEKVIRVALASGYRHLGLFNAMFKKQFGMTPTEWREQSRHAIRRPVSPSPAPKSGQAAPDRAVPQSPLDQSSTRTGTPTQLDQEKSEASQLRRALES